MTKSQEVELSDEARELLGQMTAIQVGGTLRKLAAQAFRRGAFISFGLEEIDGKATVVFGMTGGSAADVCDMWTQVDQSIAPEELEVRKEGREFIAVAMTAEAMPRMWDDMLEEAKRGASADASWGSNAAAQVH